MLDTDTATHVLQGHPRVIRRLQEGNDPDVCTTVITRAELLRGRFDFLLKATGEQLLVAQERLRTTEEFLGRVRVLSLEKGALDTFERLRRVKGLKKIGHADLLIASIVLAHRAILVTRNNRHFGLVPGLQLENWVD